MLRAYQEESAGTSVAGLVSLPLKPSGTAIASVRYRAEFLEKFQCIHNLRRGVR
jgi:hypothetical protein